VVHLNSRVLTFLLNATFRVNCAVFLFSGVYRNSWVSLILFQEYFLRKFGHFTDLDGTVILRDATGSSLGVSILTPKSRVSYFLQNVTFPCILRRIHVLACASEFMHSVLGQPS